MSGKVERFEDLEVFKCARELTNEIFAMSEDFKVFRSFSLRDQMRRSAISVMSNIAEGFERRTKAEFIHFLYIAKGSAGEVRAQFIIAHDQKYVSDDTFEVLHDKCKKVSSMLSNFIKYLESEKAKISK